MSKNLSASIRQRLLNLAHQRNMQQRSSQKHSTHHLKRIIEEIVEDECKLSPRGLLFLVDELEVSGHPPARISVWGTLHFLPLGSPFCCLEPECHLGLYAGRQERICDGVRRRLSLTQSVAIEFSGISSMVPSGVTSHPWAGMALKAGTAIDERDGLGRTALMRAAIHGQDHPVEALLEAGADPSIADNRGRTILEQVPRSCLWIITLLEQAIAKGQSRSSPGNETV